MAGFTAAQLIKMLIVVLKSRGKASGREILAWTMKSGGMPSGHSASFVAVCTVIGLTQGFDTPIFALAVCTTVVIIYDALNVRYAVGEQGKLLNELVARWNKRMENDLRMENGSRDGAKTKNLRPLKLVEGHKFWEVVVGIWLGVMVGLAVYLAFSVNF